jgi:hypothetical protein
MDLSGPKFYTVKNLPEVVQKTTGLGLSLQSGGELSHWLLGGCAWSNGLLLVDDFF